MVGRYAYVLVLHDYFTVIDVLNIYVLLENK